MSTELNLVLHENQAAQYLGVSVSTLRRVRHAGKGPSFVRIGRTVLYRKHHLDTFINQHTKNPDQNKDEKGDENKTNE